MSTPPSEDLFDFSSNAPPARRPTSSLSLTAPIANTATTAALRLSRTLKYPLHRKSFTVRNSMAMSLTPPESPDVEEVSDHQETPKLKTGPLEEINEEDPVSSDDYEEAPQMSSGVSSISTDFPFLRAIHAFDSSSLPKLSATAGENDPTTICLSFQESDIALLHSVHASGWGDATLLSTGQRGWIPTNYFAPYAETKVIPLLSAVLNFVTSPKSYPLRDDDSPTFTFSQASITNIVSGVRSLLEGCGTLTRDTTIVRRSQSIRKFRKSLLTELAILVSLAKQYRNTTDDAAIEKLVVVCYKIITKAVMFLDVWVIDVNINDEDDSTTTYEPSIYGGSSIYGFDTLSETSSRAEPEAPESTASLALASTPTTISMPGKTDQEAAASAAGTNRMSVIFHAQPPFADRRLDEVNEALTSYLGMFIHRMTILESDPSGSTQILVNTRRSMLACRELLATVECISSKSLPRNRELERSKDTLFVQIRTLVASAREVVNTATTQNTQDSEMRQQSIETLIKNATACAQSACECVIRCRNIIDKVGDFQLPSIREYPDFSDGMIAVSYQQEEVPEESEEQPSIVEAVKRLSIVEAGQQQSTNILPNIPVLSPIIPADSGPGSPDSLHSPARPVPQVVRDSNGKLRAASIEALMAILTDEAEQQDPFLMSTFFLTFRMFTTPSEVVRLLIDRYEVDTDEDSLGLYELEDLSSRRVKIFNFIKRWMESHWKQSIDGPVMNDILALSEKCFGNILPNANLIIRDLASKLAFSDLKDGEPIIPRTIAMPSGQTSMAAPVLSASSSGKSLSRHQVNLLNRANEVNGLVDAENVPADDAKSFVSTTTWTSSLRMRPSLGSRSTTRAGSLASSHYHSAGGGNNPNGPPTISILDFDHTEIANQLTLIDSGVFCNVTPEELIDENFTKKKRHLNLAPRVTQMTAISNELSAYVGDSILSGDMPAKARRNLLKHWIRIADRCFELKNFNSLLSIVSALQSVNIMRLKRIWDLLSPKYHVMFQNLKKVLMPDKNFAFYRSKLKNISAPCIPYLGLYLSDLIFIDEGNPKYKEVGQVKMVNLDRFDRLTKLIGGLQQFQVHYRLQPLPELQTWLKGAMRKAHLLLLNDQNELWRRSCIVEPRGA
jgi:hypothetical protein